MWYYSIRGHCILQSCAYYKENMNWGKMWKHRYSKLNILSNVILAITNSLNFSSKSWDMSFLVKIRDCYDIEQRNSNRGILWGPLDFWYIFWPAYTGIVFDPSQFSGIQLSWDMILPVRGLYHLLWWTARISAALTILQRSSGLYLSCENLKWPYKWPLNRWNITVFLI